MSHTPRCQTYRYPCQIYSVYTVVVVVQIWSREGLLQAKSGTIWAEAVIPRLQEKGAIGPTLELQCSRHKVCMMHEIDARASLDFGGVSSSRDRFAQEHHPFLQRVQHCR